MPRPGPGLRMTAPTTWRRVAFYDTILMALFNTDAVGQLARATGGASRKVAESKTEPGDAGRYADAFGAAVDEHAATLRRYVNDRADPGDRVVAVRFADRNGTRTERYVVASAGSSGDVDELRVLDPGGFEELDRGVDHRLELDWYLSRNAADELRRFVEEFAEDGRDPSQSYVAKTAAKYGDSVEGDLFDAMVARFD